MSLLDAVIAAKISGSGGSVTPASIVTATGQMTSQQAATTRENLGAVPANRPRVVAPSVIEDSGTEGIYLNVWYDDDVPVCEILGTAGDEPVRDYGIAPPEQDADAANKRYVDGYQNTVTSSTPTITPIHNTTYKCGTLTSLTISNPPSTGAYSIVFTSGSTATSTTFPATILGLESFAAEANTLYELNVLDSRAVVGSWAVSA